LHRSLKRKLVIGLAALSVAAFAGGAYAATQSSTPNTRQAFLNDVAKRLHVTPQQLTQALNGATTDQLQAAVKAGRLTQAQANQLEQRLKQNGNAPAVPFGFFGGPGPGPGPGVGPGYGPGPRFALPGGPGRPFFGGGIGGPIELQGAASYLGLTDAQLFQQLASGKSLAQIATAQHKTASGLEQAITTSIKTRLDKLVANKMITAAQEKAILQRLSSRLATAINQKGLLPLKRPGLRWHGNFGTPAKPNTPVPPAYTPAPYPAPIA
jgi:AraC-like DNA-binding protein